MKKVVLILIILMLVSTVGAQQFWYTVGADRSFSDLSFNINNEMRFDQGLYYEHTELNFKYALSKLLAVSLTYRKIGGNYDEHRPMINGHVTYKIGKLKLTDRNRFEYRVKEDQSNQLRYRNKLKVSFYGFYVADEIYLDPGLYRNRLYFGYSTKTTVKLGTFYLIQKTGDRSIRVIGLSIGL